MKILMLSKEGDGCGVAWRLRQEGHDVDLFIQHPEFGNALQGIVNRVEAWRPVLTDADFIVCDMVGFGHYEEVLRKSGRPYFSCNRMADVAELDRQKQMELFRTAGIITPDWLGFAKPVDAVELVDYWEPPGYVVKPSQNQDPELTMYCPNPAVFLWLLRKLDQQTPLVVQRYVQGIEVSCEGWWNGRRWVEPFNVTFEEKKLIGSSGTATGCMGNVVLAVSPDCRLAMETVRRLEPFLKKSGYRGPVDINSMVVDGSRSYALELSARMGYDAIEALAEGLQGSLCDLLFETATAVNRTMPLSSDPCVAVRLSTFPWPGGVPDVLDLGMPITGIDERNANHVFVADAMIVDGQMQWAASDGIICKTTAHGKTLSQAIQRAYRTARNITFPNKQMLPTIGRRVIGDLNQLIQWGWIDGCSRLQE